MMTLQRCRRWVFRLDGRLLEMFWSSFPGLYPLELLGCLGLSCWPLLSAVLPPPPRRLRYGHKLAGCSCGSLDRQGAAWDQANK